MILNPRFPLFSALLLAGFLSVTNAPAATAPAAPLERDLAQGLGYVRLHRLPADLPANPPGRVQPCVIDARYTEAEADGAIAFVAWLKFRATPRSPVFVLINASTSPAVLTALAAHDSAAGIVVVGVATATLKPDSPVKISPEDERRAYDALANGAALDALLSDNLAKVRNDEASLTKGHTGDTPVELPADAPPARRAGLPVDVALQRAVHLHRALVALKKI